MRQMKGTKQDSNPSSHKPVDYRSIPRTPVSFGLMYSGMVDDQEVLLGDGSVINLSKGGLGIRGNQPVRVGMELALFLYLPDGEDPLFILETRVAWADHCRFGVEFKKLSLREGSRLQSFLRTQSFQHT